jgi:hypothetical protein
MTQATMTREEALLAVRNLLHGDSAKACMPPDLRYAIDTAICNYGHAVATEVLRSVYLHLSAADLPVTEQHGLRVVGSLDGIAGEKR